MGEIHVTKYKILVDIHTFRLRISKMQMATIIGLFIRSEKGISYKFSSNEINILFLLASYMGNKINCWPSIKSLILVSSLSAPRVLSKSTLIRNIKKLESKKILLIKKEINKNNEYEFSDEVVSHRNHKVVSHRHPNIINNNIINNRNSYPQPKNFKQHELSQTASEPSELLKWYKSNSKDK